MRLCLNPGLFYMQSQFKGYWLMVFLKSQMNLTAKYVLISIKFIPTDHLLLKFPEEGHDIFYRQSLESKRQGSEGSALYLLPIHYKFA